MKKRTLVALSGALLLALLAGCGGQGGASSEAVSTPVNNTQQSGVSTPAESIPTPPQDLAALNEVYDSLAAAAGLEATISFDMMDLNAAGNINEDDILAMAAGKSIVGGDSGLVIVLACAPGTAEAVQTQVEAFRDSLVNGPAYDEFADAQQATQNARIVAVGDLVVYAAVSVETGADYAAVDAAIAAIEG